MEICGSVMKSSLRSGALCFKPEGGSQTRRSLADRLVPLPLEGNFYKSVFPYFLLQNSCWIVSSDIPADTQQGDAAMSDPVIQKQIVSRLDLVSFSYMLEGLIGILFLDVHGCSNAFSEQ